MRQGSINSKGSPELAPPPIDSVFLQIGITAGLQISQGGNAFEQA